MFLLVFLRALCSSGALTSSVVSLLVSLSPSLSLSLSPASTQNLPNGYAHQELMVSDYRWLTLRARDPTDLLIHVRAHARAPVHARK